MPRSIAVFRALQLGDMLCAVPALRALRSAYPCASITLIGLPWAREFVERFCHYVDDFVEFPGWPGLPEREPDVAAVPAFLASARSRNFDLAIQMHGDGRISNTIVAMLGARTVAGACVEDAWRPDRGLFVPYPADVPERHRALAAVAALVTPGLESTCDDLEFPLFESDREALHRVLDTAAPTVVVHPGARAESRRWPAIYFAAVADELAARGFTIAITGSAGERDLAEEVAGAMRHGARVLAGRTELGSLAALIDSSELLVCNDTGVAHLADALHTPSVVMFTGSDRARWASPDRMLHRAVSHPDTLDPQRVLSHAHDLLSREPAYAL